MKNQFLRPNGVENVSNMSQPVWNIIIDDQKHILDLNKSHKGPLKKSASPPPHKKNSQILTRCGFHGNFDIGNLEGIAWTLFSQKGLVGLKVTSGDGKKPYFLPYRRSWNNYLQMIFDFLDIFEQLIDKIASLWCSP